MISEKGMSKELSRMRERGEEGEGVRGDRWKTDVKRIVKKEGRQL